jgi:hypothetical protein
MLLEEQFAIDKDYMIQRYNFDIATGRPVTSISSSENEEEAETETVAGAGSHDGQNSCPVPGATNEEVGNHCIPESEVGNRSGRYSPYSKQKRITGKSTCVIVNMARLGGGGGTVFEFVFSCQCYDHLKHIDVFRYHLLQHAKFLYFPIQFVCIV